MQSGLLGRLRGSISTGQTATQLPQEVHSAVSTDSRKRLTLLKSPRIAPRGHTVRQKGLMLTIIQPKKATSSATFHTNNRPTWARISAFAATRGRPASNVPVGQIHLQNQVSPYPNASTTKKRQDEDRQGQHDVLQIAEKAGDAQLGSGDLVDKLLEEAERTEPAAREAPHQRSHHAHGAQYIQAELKLAQAPARPGAGHHVLHGADGAGGMAAGQE